MKPRTVRYLEVVAVRTSCTRTGDFYLFLKKKRAGTISGGGCRRSSDQDGDRTTRDSGWIRQGYWSTVEWEIWIILLANERASEKSGVGLPPLPSSIRTPSPACQLSRRVSLLGTGWGLSCIVGCRRIFYAVSRGDITLISTLSS